MSQYVPDELVELFIDTWNAHNKEDFWRGAVRRERLNYGWCYQFAYLMKKLHGDIVELHHDYGHAWVKIGDKYYDSDQPQGVDDPHKFMCGPRYDDSMKHNVTEEEFVNFWSTGGTGPIQTDVVDEVILKFRMRNVGA